VNVLDIAYALTAVATAPWWMRKTRSGWAERFARVLPEAPDRREGRLRIMLHAVSVGEVNALRELVPLLAAQADVVVTASTDTGIARARDLFAERCTVARYPLDASWAVGRFLDAVRPDVVGLVELELWPNFVRACAAREIPVAVVNGRLSERSFRGYRRIRRWMSPAFASLSVAAVQDETYAGRFHAMGVPRERVVVTGSMKFDSSRIEDEVAGAAELARAMGIDRTRLLVVAGSTGPGEEALLHEACRRASELGGGDASTIQLLCAPRKPERFAEAARALPGCVRRTSGTPSLALQCGVEVDGGGGGSVQEPSVAQKPPAEAGGSERGRGSDIGTGPDGASRFLLDTIGELRLAYALADVAVVGRSFFDQHGSDPIEPIALGCATIIGPAVSDFAEIVGSLESGSGLLRADRENLHEVVGGLLGDASARSELVLQGRACIRRLQGASARHAELLLWMAGSRGEDSDGSAEVLRATKKHGNEALESPSPRA